MEDAELSASVSIQEKTISRAVPKRSKDLKQYR